ncbi:hypothetical protein SO802_022319 [Lithocarpus litseifolius]|uniref:TF-B3 domain-containing protein n=1 Tax=Lithocarpus litseifolius TaxID=425828 RepID=A0AAW2CIT2_9ROSI
MDKGQFMVKIFFSQNLKVIPKTFSDNLKKKLPQSATLKGPSGLTWDVELTTNDGATFFNHGWQNFVKDHSLEETDLLIFSYNGWSQFDVLIFDGKNMCEKGASYFVRKCGQTEHDNKCLTKKRLKEGSMDDVHTPLDVDAGCTSPVNSMGDDNVTVPSEQCINSLVAKKRTRQSAESSVMLKMYDILDHIKWIPTEWVMNHPLMENQEIYLHFNEGTWRAK